MFYTVEVHLPGFCRARVSFLVLEFQDQIRQLMLCSCDNLVERFGRPDQLVSVRESHLLCYRIRQILSYVSK